MISLVLCTLRRQPQFSWIRDSLLRSAAKWPEVEWQLTVIDGRLWYDNYVERTAPLRGVASLHTVPKPTPWQGPNRLTARDYWSLNNARNTGIAYARGDYITLFDDCSCLDEDFLKRHWEARNRGVVLAGSFRSWSKATVVNGQVTVGELHPQGIDSRGSTMQRAAGGWLWGLNCGFPLVAALQVNGYDEMYCGQGGSEDCDLGVRLERAGWPVIYDPSCLVNQILETHEPVGEHTGWGEAPPPTQAKQKELRVRRDGEYHFANEHLIERLLLDEPERTQPLGNDFDLSELRRTLRFPTKRTTTIDWRDGQPLEEM